jgi:stage III sporulation protein SpoIIIAA
MQQSIDQELEAIIDKLPPHIAEPLVQREDKTELLLEVVLDLGREPEARFLNESYTLSSEEVTAQDIEYVTQRIGPFGGDNRAGLERTLHRISAIRNRNGKVVGLTLRVGRAVYGTIQIIEDLILTGKSVLLLGKPGVGKTTMLREVARVLADDAHKRVVVVDTSNEIAGDGDIPHPGIGRARRMQVHSPEQQHAVMIEAVENHMPEVIIIDEIGTELEANAARTIAERGVQLVATAHGNTLENLVLNPTLSDLVGGVQSVTLGDIEARRRRTQKTVLERRAPPTFDILVEIRGWSQVAIHSDLAEVVDRMLRGLPVTPEGRTMDEHGNVHRTRSEHQVTLVTQNGGGGRRFESQPAFEFRRAPNRPAPEKPAPQTPARVTHILPYGVNKGKLQQAMQALRAPVELVAHISDADLLLTTKNFYRRRTQALREAEEKGKPVYVLRKNTTPQIHQFFRSISRSQAKEESQGKVARAIEEAEEAVVQIDRIDHQAELSPQGAYVRHLQHQIAEEHGLTSSSTGREPSRHVVIYRP